MQPVNCADLAHQINPMSILTHNAITRALHKRHRDHDLAASASWPITEAHTLKAVIVPKDELAEGTNAQDSQLEIPYYFTLPESTGHPSGYFGGHLRTVALSSLRGLAPHPADPRRYRRSCTLQPAEPRPEPHSRRRQSDPPRCRRLVQLTPAVTKDSRTHSLPASSNQPAISQTGALA